jgi:predicted HTH transcriptional regulator
MNLAELLGRREGKTLEFKRDLSSPEGVLKAVVAFANTSGGTILLGVEDGTNKVRGIRDVLAEEERLANLISDSITPKLVPTIEVLPWRKTQVLAVEVHPSSSRPHHLNRLGPEAGVLVRVGSTNRRADEFLIDDMRRYSRVSSFDEQPMPDLNSEVIDFRVASEYFKPFRKLTKEGMETLRLTVRYQGRVVPTIGGVLLFGKERFQHFPDAWIQAGRFAGTDRRRILDSTEVRTYLPGAAEEAIAFLHKHMKREAVIGAVKRTDRWTFPEVALREIVMNAILHADYAQRGAPIRIALFDDRLEVENPGLLPFGLTIEEIQKGSSRVRNRVIGRIFQELGLVEQWGSGIQRMNAACRDHGLDPPHFEEIGTHFRVTLSAVRSHAPAMDERGRAILKALGRFPKGLSTSQIAQRLGVSPRATRTRLALLVERGFVTEIGSSPQDPHRRYYLASSGS